MSVCVLPGDWGLLGIAGTAGQVLIECLCGTE